MSRYYPILTRDSSPKWSVASSGCDKVTYTTPGFSFQDLLNCKTSSGADSIVRAVVGDTIQYNGKDILVILMKWYSVLIM